MKKNVSSQSMDAALQDFLGNKPSMETPKPEPQPADTQEQPEHTRCPRPHRPHVRRAQDERVGTDGEHRPAAPHFNLNQGATMICTVVRLIFSCRTTRTDKLRRTALRKN